MSNSFAGAASFAPTELKVGDTVAHSDPYVVAAGYRGMVEKVAGDEILVRWADRKGKANECETYSCAELRRLE